MSAIAKPTRRSGHLHLRAVGFLAALALTIVPAAAQAASGNQATAYQLDPAHDGYQTSDSITAPLSQTWSVSLPGAVSYPLIVNGEIYVTADEAAGGSGTTLYAIQQATGTTLWSQALGGTYGWSGLTYDAGQVFTVDYNGTMSAFNAQTGASDWSTSLPGQHAFSSAPTAYDGVVYVGGSGSGGTVYAVSEATGTVLWTQSVDGADDSSPAVSSAGVYVTYACGQDYDFSPLSGALIWHHTSSCSGGGGKTPVLANGDIYGRDASDGDLILSAATGTSVGAFVSTTAPAVGGGIAYTVSGGTLTAVGGSGQGTNAWSLSGDQLVTAPLVADGLLLEGSSTGTLYALNPANGATEWSGSAGSSLSGPDEQNVSTPLTGLGAGENTIVVPTGSNLVAYTGANDVLTGTPSSTVTPSVTGTPVAGQAAGADVGVWSALPTSFTYQWSLCEGGNCQAIPGATSEAYTPPTADIGDTLEVSVIATNGNGAAPAATSAASSPIIPPPPALVTSPAISNPNPTVGQTISVSNGTWTSNPSSYTYQWFSCSSASTCTAIPGATTGSLVVAASLAGDALEAQVVASDSTGPSMPATTAITSVVPIATSLTLSSSANPAQAGTQVVFTTILSRTVDAGDISFDQNGQPIPGCAGLPMTSGYIGATCTLPSMGAGSWSISVQYTGDTTYAGSSASLTETVRGATSTPSAPSTSATSNKSGTAAKTPTTPPSKSVGSTKTKGEPNFKLTLTAVRTRKAPYRYWFALKRVKCVNRASAVLVNSGRTTVDDKCGAKIELASKALAAHRYYDLTLRSVRYGRKHKVVARGPIYHEDLYMPGSEVKWKPATGIKLPELLHLPVSVTMPAIARGGYVAT